MMKLILLLITFLVFACGESNPVDDTTNLPDSTNDTTIAGDSTNDSSDVEDSTIIVDSSTFEEDSLAFLDIKVAQDEKIIVSWESYPDTNVESYVVYYNLGSEVSLGNESILVDKSSNSTSIILEKFISGEEYSFIVVANIYDGNQTMKVLSSVYSITVEDNDISPIDRVSYTLMSVDKSLGIEITSINEIVGYEVDITKIGNYAVIFSVPSSSFYPSVIVYNEDKTEILAEESGLNDINFSAIGKVFIEVSIVGDFYSGSAFIKVVSK